MNQPLPVVLCFSATDPSGGAGLQADILTVANLGCHPLSVVTAVTVQDTIGVENFLPVDPDWVNDQARCVLEDMAVHAFKIGVLGSIENIAAVAEIVSDYPEIPLVFDPVMASGRGDEFASEDMIYAMRELIVPQCTVITPNTLEARNLAQEENEDLSLQQCAQRLIEMGTQYVLITGTHENTPKVTNLLYAENGIVGANSWERLPHSYHGSGCTLASALAAVLANGIDISDAVAKAQEYTWHSLNNAYRLGMGQHIPDRFFWARENDD